MRGEIIISDLRKVYKTYVTVWDRIKEFINPYSKKHKIKTVINNINFRVNPGEAVGIIGLNGAGKSTLLKMIVGTAIPTSGEIKVTGVVAALLELGMGFHPEFTGKENVYMAGQLMEYSKTKIDELIKEIEEFSEIGEYINQPFRQYSSGMQVRLAFSVATAVRPDILIVDEALSVGDAYFQHKCFERIRKYREMGTTLLLVSHDKQAIINICDRVILLNNGEIAKVGKPEPVFDYYNAMLSSCEKLKIKQTIANDREISTSSGTASVVIESIELMDEEGRSALQFNVGEELNLKVKARATVDVKSLVMGYAIKDRLGQIIFGTNSWYCEKILLKINAKEEFEFDVRIIANLGVGSYSISVALHENESHLSENYDWRDVAKIFEIVNINRSHYIGISWLENRMQVTRNGEINFV
jgi:lipopolysaccharide transport system ATP-binding protein